jgi:hypothetical protein
MNWDRFDIVSAHYAFYCDYHGGQWSKEYARLCRISRYFRPGAAFRGFESLSDNAQEIYRALEVKHRHNPNPSVSQDTAHIDADR